MPETELQRSEFLPEILKKKVGRNKRANIDVQWKQTCQEGKKKNLSRWKVHKTLFLQNNWIKAEWPRELPIHGESHWAPLAPGTPVPLASLFCGPPPILHSTGCSANSSISKRARREEMKGMTKCKPITTVLEVDLKFTFYHFLLTKVKARRKGFSSWYPKDFLLGGSQEWMHITHCL